MFSKIEQKIWLENEIEKRLEKMIEMYGEIPEEYQEIVDNFYSMKVTWDEEIKKEAEGNVNE